MDLLQEIPVEATMSGATDRSEANIHADDADVR